MKFVKFKNIKNIQDGDYFLVVYRTGNVVLCWYSRRGYFIPLENDELIDDESDQFIKYLSVNDELLVCKVEVEVEK